MKALAVMLKDLRLITRDRFALASLLIVPIVVIVDVATATQSGEGSKSILFPIVNEDQGPVASAFIRVFREHLDVREVTRAAAERLVADENDAPAALILPPETSKRYLTARPSTVELLTDPAQWRELEAIKVIMLLADRETASLGDPFSQELIKVRERSIAGDRVSFSSLEQNIPGFILMFVLLTLIFSVSIDLRGRSMGHQPASFGRTGVCCGAARRKAASASHRRHRTVAAALAVRPLRLRTCPWALTRRPAPGGRGGGLLDDMLCRHSCGLCAYARASHPRWFGGGIRPGCARRTLLAPL
jgi:hypothetical protein